MKASDILVAAATLGAGIIGGAVAAPNPAAGAGALDTNLQRREPKSASQPRSGPPELVGRSDTTEQDGEEQEELWKRKGGGGGGGRGGGSSSGGSRGGSGGGSTGGSRGGSSGSGSGGRGSSSSNQGGRTTTGSGVTPAFGAGGGFYSGGAREPYKAGRGTPGGIVPFAVGGAGVGFLGGAYLAHGAYMYPYAHTYHYHNATTDRNETKPVVCVCGKYEECSCDDNGDDEYFRSVIGDGSYDGLNKSIVDVVKNDTDGRTYIYIDGSLPNGTTAAGGEEDPSGASEGLTVLLRAAGWWPVVSTALALAFAV